MADFTKTISNSVNTFGGITNKWNERNWGAFKWGEGTNDLPVDVMHLISEALAPDSGISERVVLHLISESLSPTSDISYEALTDGSGYFYVFPSGQTNHENQAIPSYTSGSSPGSTWTSATAGSTSWS